MYHFHCNDDSIANLTAFVEKAHASGVRVNVGVDIVLAWRKNLHYPGYRSQLDLDAAKVRPGAPQSDGFQDAATFAPGAAIPGGMAVGNALRGVPPHRYARNAAEGVPYTARSQTSWNHATLFSLGQAEK